MGIIRTLVNSPLYLFGWTSEQLKMVNKNEFNFKQLIQYCYAKQTLDNLRNSAPKNRIAYSRLRDK